jgi:hypothetical protein
LANERERASLAHSLGSPQPADLTLRRALPRAIAFSYSTKV